MLAPKANSPDPGLEAAGIAAEEPLLAAEVAAGLEPDEPVPVDVAEVVAVCRDIISWSFTAQGKKTYIRI
jgi:hypothetical protein